MKTHASPWIILFSISLFLLVINMNVSIVALALPNISASLGLDFSLMQWVSNGYTLAAAVCLIPLSCLSKKWSNRQVYLLTIALFVVGSYLAASWDHPWTLIIGRILQGIGFASLPMGIVLVNHAFPAKERGFAFSLCVASVGIGLALGPVLGGWILTYFTWRAIFYVNMFMGLLCLISSMSILEADAPIAPKMSFDWMGMLWLFSSLVPWMLLFSHMRWWGLTSSRTLCVFFLSLLSSIALFYHVKRQNHPIFDPKIFSITNARLCIVKRTCFMMCFAAILYMVPLELQNVEGHPTSYAATLMLAMSAVMVMFSPVCGKAIDRFGFKKPLLTSAMLSCLAFAILLCSEGSLMLTLMALALFGVSASAMFAGGTYGMSHALNKAQMSTGMGLFFTSANMGISLGMTLSGSLMSYLSEGHLRAEMAAKGWHLSPASLETVQSVASGAHPISQMASLTEQYGQALQPMVHQSFMYGFHGVMGVCLLLSFVILYGAFCLKPCEKSI